MIAKIIKNDSLSSVSIGQIGKVLEDLGGGVTLSIPTTYIDNFGGQTKFRRCSVFFNKNEVEIRKEDVATVDEWASYFLHKPKFKMFDKDQSTLITEEEYLNRYRTANPTKDEPKTS